MFHPPKFIELTPIQRLNYREGPAAAAANCQIHVPRISKG